MCGIIGCIGNINCVEEVLSGLSFLEYRGYDSSGIAMLEENRILVFKKKGRVSVLRSTLPDTLPCSSVCIGHTRWATHGAPEDKNAHPFLSNDNRFAIVHNGVVENCLELKNKLLDLGFDFTSDTDSEVIANLIQYCYKGDILLAFSEAVKSIIGSYAIALISSEDANSIYVAKRGNPLLVGLQSGTAYVCSDYSGMSTRLDFCAALEDDNIGYITPTDLHIFDYNLIPVSLSLSPIIRECDLSIQGYSHYMKKEISEIPAAVSRAVNSYYLHSSKISFSDFNRIVFIGCGTALHACLVAKRILRELVPLLDSYAESAGEFVFSEYPIENTLFIAVSQSGETADTLFAVKKIKKRHGKVLAICNVPSSSIVREANETIYTLAGPEISVASTKAYNCQIAVLTALCLDIAKSLNGNISYTCINSTVCELMSIPSKLKSVLSSEAQIAQIAKEFLAAKSVFYLGRGLDYCVACEGSLKLKEISYVHSEAYEAGELKHGTLALIENNVLIIAIVTQRYIINKMITCLTEVQSRGAKTVVITPFHDEKLLRKADRLILIPESADLFSPLISVIPTQLFAYYSALYRNRDIDKPRNLAKSVTVD